MKFIIREDSQIWNGDTNSLPEGTYYIVKKVETIRIIGSNNVKHAFRDAIIKKDPIFHSDDNEVENVDLTKPVNGDDIVGKIRYWQGLRYSQNSDGNLERFPASDEPQMHEGRLFNGYMKQGKFQWNDMEPVILNDAEQAALDKERSDEFAKRVKEQQELEMVMADSSVLNDELILEDISEDEAKELAQLAKEYSTKKTEVAKKTEAVESEEPFNDEAFLDDIANLENHEPEFKQEVKTEEKTLAKTTDKSNVENKCIIEENLTLLVTFDGKKYKKKFKNETIAKAQKDSFEKLLKENIATVKELLSGTMSTFTEVK